MGKPRSYRRFMRIRKVATTRELRSVEFARFREEPAFRPKRGNLPTTWSDIKRTVQRTWKSHRRTRYKPVRR